MNTARMLSIFVFLLSLSSVATVSHATDEIYMGEWAHLIEQINSGDFKAVAQTLEAAEAHASSLPVQEAGDYRVEISLAVNFADHDAVMRWVDSGESPHWARLTAGIQLVDQGMDARGHKYASETGQSQLESMDAHFVEAMTYFDPLLADGFDDFLVRIEYMTIAAFSKYGGDVSYHFQRAVNAEPYADYVFGVYGGYIRRRFGGDAEDWKLFFTALNSSMEKKPSLAKYHYYPLFDMASDLDEGTQLPEVIELYRLAMEAKGDYHGQLARGLRYALWKNGETAEALEVAQKIVAVEPHLRKNWRALRGLGLAEDDYAACHLATVKINEFMESAYNYYQMAWCALPLYYFEHAIEAAHRGLEILTPEDEEKHDKLRLRLEHMASRNAELLSQHRDEAKRFQGYD